MKSFDVLSVAANTLNDKKARDLSAFEVGGLTILSDYILIATANSSTHVRSLADEVEEKLTEHGIEPHHVEGRATGWILLDYNEVIIHIFDKTSREFYGLDRIWSDGKPINLSEILTSPMEV